MMPRTAIAQIAKIIGRELDTGVGPSEEALAAGSILADAGATTEIIGSLLAEAQRERPDDRMMPATPSSLRVHSEGCGYSRAAETSGPTVRSQTCGTGSMMPSRRAASPPRCLC
jgi:hypothetical protein